MAVDFNNDGRDDVLWRNRSSFDITTWFSGPDGRFIANDAGTYALPGNWFVADTGDYNGDGLGDILFTSNTGRITNWLGTGGGRFTANDVVASIQITSDSYTAGSGDFNGDGRDDLLVRSFSTGDMSIWTTDAAGAFHPGTSWAGGLGGWSIAATADFNGDGYDDIAWTLSNRAFTVWFGKAGNQFDGDTPIYSNGGSMAWGIEGAGDFNGDGFDDLLWRHEQGAVTTWLGRANGGFTANDAAALTQNSPDWYIVGTGDFNGDHRGDILWRQNTGAIAEWSGTAAGGFTPNPYAYALVSTDWIVQPGSQGWWDY
jgi:hypothetical protein